MSRSYKKYPVTGFTCKESDKPFKVKEHRKRRKEETQKLNSELEDFIPPSKHKYGSSWDSPKDGKHWWQYDQDKAKRK